MVGARDRLAGATNISLSNASKSTATKGASSPSERAAVDKAAAAKITPKAPPKAPPKEPPKTPPNKSNTKDSDLQFYPGTFTPIRYAPTNDSNVYTPTDEPIIISGGTLKATPPSPDPDPIIVQKIPVKTAPIDTVLFDDTAVPIEVMSDLIFENIGGQELISIARSTTVNGQKISYQPIKNLSSIQQQYNPNNILGLQQTSNRFFAGFSIKLENKIPEVGNGLNGENIYFDQTNGSLVIEFVNLNNDEQVEVQITANGTIYEANLGDYIS